METKYINYFIFITVLTTSSVFCDSTDICKICKCLKEDNILNIECQKNSMENGDIFDLNNLHWPINSDKNLKIKAYFNHLDIKNLPKLNGDPSVTDLNFGNNMIETISNEPFQNFPNLMSVSLANNRLSVLNRDFFKMTNKLRHLDLSNNSMTNVDALIFSRFDHLESIDLSYNKLSTISTELMNSLRNTLNLNFEGSQVYALGNTVQNSTYKWKVLNLSRNKLSAITSSTFESLEDLEALHLSQNQITVIDKHAFSKLEKLKMLELSHNKLEDFSISLSLPNTLEMINFENNKLKLWPFTVIPSNLVKLEIQSNELFELFTSEESFENLKFLNISDNRIEHLPGEEFPALLTLDVSYNQFTSVPQNLGKRAPLLQDLILDNNPIETVDFVDRLTLSRMSISNMPLLKSLDAYAFSNVVGIKIRDDGKGTCAEIKVSHCPLLKEIHEKAFENVDLCKLDLSYNQLTTISENLAKWNEIESGIDLQGNPFICSCNLQWMLDTILMQLYQNAQLQYLLSDLKCYGPEPLKSHRFVKYYKKYKAFCNAHVRENLKMEILSAGIGAADDDHRLHLHKGSGLVIIIALSVIVVLSLTATGIYLTIDQKKRLRKYRNYNNRLMMDT